MPIDPYRPDPTAKPAASAGPSQNPPPETVGPPESNSTGQQINIYAPSPDLPDIPNPPQPPPNDPAPQRNPAVVSRPTPHQGAVQESAKKGSVSVSEGSLNPPANQATTHGPELSAHKVEALVRALLAETHLITHSPENAPGLLRFSSSVPSSLLSQASAASRGAMASADHSFHGVFQLLSSSGRTTPPSLPHDLKLPSSSLLPQEAGSLHGKPLGASISQNSPTGEPMGAVRQNLLQSLSALLVSQGGTLQGLNKSVLQAFAGLLGLPLSYEGFFLARTLVPQEVPISWGGFPSVFPRETPGAFKAFLQGIAQLLELPGMKGMTPLLPPVWRAFFGIFFTKGMEIQLRTYHSSLMDELGALLSRSSRRDRKRDRRQVGRADRVQRKDQSLPTDPDVHDGDQTLPDDIDAWQSPSRSEDRSGFTFYLH